MDLVIIEATLRSSDNRCNAEDYIAEGYNVDVCDNRRMLLSLSSDEMILVESKIIDTFEEEVYRLTMTDGYKGIAKLVNHFGIDISDKDTILDKMFDLLADLVGRDGDLDKIIKLLKELDINYTESY